MNWLKRRRSDAEKQLDDELQFHVERLIDEYVRQGMSAEAARRRALVEFGGAELAKEECREVRPLASLEQLFRDLWYALRILRRQPGFTAAAVLTLALGIGANTAIFSVVDALLLRKLPVRDPTSLVALQRTYQGDGRAPHWFDFEWFEQFRDLKAVFSDAAAIHPVDRSDVLNGSPDDSSADPQVSVRLVTGNYFSVMGVSAYRGRTFTLDDDQEVSSPVAVISHSYWQRRFGSDPDIAGRTVRIGNARCTIVGITPPGFTGEWVGKPADLWVPVALASSIMTEMPPTAPRVRGMGLGFHVLARIQPDISREQARATGQLLYQRILKERGGAHPSEGVLKRIAAARLELGPGGIGFSPQRQVFMQPLAILLGLAGLVLLITCANVANLLLSRGASREREMALRRAIGASGGRLVRQLLTESLALASMGGALGLLLAYWGTQALAKMASSGLVWQESQQLVLDLRPDVRVFAFTAGLSLAVGILFGLAPALRGAEIGGQASLSRALNQRANAFTRRFSLARLLVAAQVALSIVLVMGAGMMVRTLRNLKAQEMGLDREHVLLIWTAFRQAGRQFGADSARLFEQVQQRLSASPGVIAASGSTRGLLQGQQLFPYPVKVQGTAPEAGERPMAQRDLVMPGFFDATGMRLLSGRDFSAHDSETAPPVVIVNETLARRYFGSGSALGQRIGFGFNATGSEMEIVGVVSDAIQTTPYATRSMMFYVPYRQDIGRLHSLCLVVRTRGNPAILAGSLRQELRAVDPRLPVLRINTIDGQLDDLLVQERMIASLSGLFAVLAMGMACVGLYGVVAHQTVRRTGEIGVRLALGATRGGVLAMVLQQNLWPVLVGIAVGAPAAVGASRAIATRLFGITPADPLTIAIAALLMIATALLACLVPARRASRIDPMEALRHE